MGRGVVFLQDFLSVKDQEGEEASSMQVLGCTVCECKARTAALALYSVFYTSYTISKAGLGGPEALVGRAQMFEFLGQSCLEGRELLDGECRDVDATWLRHIGWSDSAGSGRNLGVCRVAGGLRSRGMNAE